MNSLPIILSAMIAFAATLSAGILVKKFKSNIGVVCAFSAGFFIALVLFNLLPDVFSMVSGTRISPEIPLLAGAGGFFLLFAFDLVFSKFHLKNHHMTDKSLRPRIGLLSTMEFCSHGFIEGLAIGMSFQLEFGLGLFVAAAVVSHDFCDGINTLALMLNSGNTIKSSMGMLLVDAIAPVLGAFTAFLFSIGNYFLVPALSFLAGSFLYIGGGTLLPDANRMNRPIITVVFFALGFILIVLLTAIGI